MTDPFDRSFRERILAGETLFGPVPRPRLAAVGGALRRGRFDWLLVDLEHGAATEADLLAHLRAIEGAGADGARPAASGERLRIGRALDTGAAGVVIPRLDSTAEAREAVSFLRYPPAGVRGVAPLTRGAGLGPWATAT